MIVLVDSGICVQLLRYNIKIPIFFWIINRVRNVILSSIAPYMIIFEPMLSDNLSEISIFKLPRESM